MYRHYLIERFFKYGQETEQRPFKFETAKKVGRPGLDGNRLRHVGPAVVPRFETYGKRVRKQGFIHRTVIRHVFCFINARFVELFVCSFLRTELAFLFQR